MTVWNPWRRSPRALSPAAALAAYALLAAWATVVLFPLFWILVTSFKLPIHVYSGPVYLPFVDFTPSLHAWRYILVDLRNDTLRPYASTVVVALTSSILAVALGTAAGYGLLRFRYRPRLSAILLAAAAAVVAIAAVARGLAGGVAVAVGLVTFLAGRPLAARGQRAVANDDIAFWMISQRILPPVAVVIPLYVMFQRLGLLDTRVALIVTYTAVNLPIVVWLMRDYFRHISVELEESAAIDGASAFRIFRSIVLPLSAPGLAATFLLVLVFTWNEYLLALFLTGANAQTLPLSIAAQNATRGPQWWYMSVLILLMITPVILMAVALERYIAKGLLVGAIKG
ncbi:MAG: carbohydrate ABC transporter permease [Armatimonadota bacterium]|nr:carbohydrate ABC transporter permease [Armatimonadota bacterium]MDR7574474.1 carbohydrate ABC transporter permease [Armatimonadota bacterium]